MKKLSLFYIVIASVLWGTAGIFVNFLSPYGVNSIELTLIRSGVSFLCIGIYILLTNRKLFRANIKEILLSAGSGLSFLFTASCYFYSLQLTSISTAVVLMYTAPIFVMIYSVAFLEEKLTKIKAASVICMIVGCALVSGVIGGLKFDVVGILMGFMAGISYAAYNIFTKIEMKKKINPIKATFYCFLFATLGGAILSNPITMVKCMMVEPKVTVALAVGMGVLTGVLPYFLYTLSLKVLPAGTAASIGILEPLAATVFSVLVFHESLSIASISGIILILGAVFVISKQKE